MKPAQLISIIFSCCIFLLTTHTASAADTLDLACPTAEHIHQFSYEAAFPYGFNNQSKRVKFFADAAEPENTTSERTGDWLLFIYPIEVQQSEEVQGMMKTTLEKLLPYSTVPFQFNLTDDLQLPFCIYTLPGNNDVNAIAYFVDNGFDDEDTDYDFSSKIQSKVNHHRLRMMQIAQHAKQLLLK